MIKINLATRKQAAGGDGKAPRSSSGGLPQLDLSLLKGLPIRRVAFPAIAAIAANYLLENFKTEELKKMDEALAVLSAEQSKLQVEVGKIKNFDPIKKALDQDEAVLRTKLETIQKLLADRSSSPKMLVSISTGIPNDVWLTGFRVTKADVVIKGGALGYNQISDFMKNLSESAFFTDLVLKDSQQTKQDQSEIAMFELTGKRR